MMWLAKALEVYTNESTSVIRKVIPSAPGVEHLVGCILVTNLGLGVFFFPSLG